MHELHRTFVNVNEVSLEVFAVGQGDTLALCLHGFPEHAISWRNQMSVLADRGFTVWAPNLRGYGNSTMPTDVDGYRLGRLVEDVHGLISESECRRVVLIGHDWGATVAWFAALQGHASIAALIVLNSYWPGNWPELLKGQQAARSTYLPILLSWMPESLNAVLDAAGMNKVLDSFLARIGHASEEVLQLYRWNISRPGALTAMLNYYRANLNLLSLELGALRSLNNELNIPTLMINGAMDPFIDKRLTSGKHELLTDLETHDLPGVLHWAPQEAPRQVNASMLDWLRDKQLLPERTGERGGR
jgi:pimeloyl-ACP methyl ester carboxylesterase